MFSSIKSWWKSLKPLKRLHPPAKNIAANSATRDDISTTAAEVTPQWLIVGLGNPGTRYAGTRHNAGFLVLDQIVAPGEIKLLKPTTFMNSSGEEVAPLLKTLGLGPERLIVIHDELDFPAGRVRLKKGGHDNGHNGLKSITKHLGTSDYLRVRVGIGRPPKGVSIIDWVLGEIREAPTLASFGLAAQAALLITTVGFERAQTDINAR
ncbi:aminoacyl-tRNA hydrolase [Corynebacterium caspium]|uniref:aminoacyl-tRNA hydrolase n=1 Tax=Corynebacterium caspium TaxID=234828 RepID=UPI00036C07A1|nr:aminoacyl-tRNA hydrolase [Corynebacterium caspium]WKD59587.1 Peptidyl-tRNA hydrolase [Corynebacterium caspium DSM 44850]